MQNALFGTNQRQQLRFGIKVYIVPTFVEACHSLAQLGSTLCGLIAMGIRLTRHLTQFLNGSLRRRHVRAAYSQTDDVLTLGIQLGDLLQLATEVILAY